MTKKSSTKPTGKPENKSGSKLAGKPAQEPAEVHDEAVEVTVEDEAYEESGDDVVEDAAEDHDDAADENTVEDPAAKQKVKGPKVKAPKKQAKKKAGKPKEKPVKKATEKKPARQKIAAPAEKKVGLTPQEEKTIADAVTFINERYDSSVKSHIEIGQYILEHFFGNDIKKVREKAPRKEISLRKLALRPDLNIPVSTLARSVQLAIQELEFPTVATSRQLTPSHRLLLLAVENADEKAKYIEKIEKDELSVRGFREMLIKDEFIKKKGLAHFEEDERKLRHSGFSRILSPIESLLEGDFTLGILDKLSGPMAKDTLDKAERAKLRLDEVIAYLKKRK